MRTYEAAATASGFCRPRPPLDRASLRALVVDPAGLFNLDRASLRALVDPAGKKKILTVLLYVYGSTLTLDRVR